MKTITNFLLPLLFTGLVSAISPPAYAVITVEGNHTYFTTDENEYKKITYLVQPESELSYRSDFHPFLDASQVLFLGDSFYNSSLSLCAQVQSWVPSSTTLFRTDMDCPKNEQIENVVNHYVDHQEPLPFADNQFETIILRKGLCHCHCKNYSCGGLLNNSDSLAAFLGEISRVLNKTNPHSSGYLHGGFYRFSPGEMNHFLANWDRAIQIVQDHYPQVKYTLFHEYADTCQNCLKRRLAQGDRATDFDSSFFGLYVSISNSAE